jgi:hypothetical protein
MLEIAGKPRIGKTAMLPLLAGKRGFIHSSGFESKLFSLLLP